MTIEQANANVARAEQVYAKAAGEMRAAAYADQRAAVAQHQSEADAADKAQAITGYYRQ